MKIPARLNKLFLNGLIAARGGLPDDFVRKDFTQAVDRHPDLKEWMDANCVPNPGLTVYEQAGDVLSDWIKEAESRAEALRKVARAIRMERDYRWSKRDQKAIKNGTYVDPFKNGSTIKLVSSEAQFESEELDDELLESARQIVCDPFDVGSTLDELAAATPAARPEGLMTREEAIRLMAT